jgi:hypothetical protein
MALLVLRQLRRLSKRHHRNDDDAPAELTLSLPHLAEMRLARQSSQVTQKNQQEIFVEMSGETGRLAVEGQQRQLCKVNLFHIVRQNLPGLSMW